MHPILLTIPGTELHIYSFGAMIAVAYFIGSLYLERLAKRFGDDPKGDPPKYANLSLWLLLGIVGGGRLLYAIVHPDEFAKKADGTSRTIPEIVGQVLAIWNGGLVFYGGFIAAFMLGLWKGKQYKLRRWHAADLAMIAGFLGLGIGRIGCYLVGDDHGRLCAETLPFPIAFTVPDPLPKGSFFDPTLAGHAVYATQIWMMVNGFVLAAIGRWILGRPHFAGQVTFTISGLYAVTRGVIEYFRGDDAARGYTDVNLFGETLRLYTSIKIGLVLLPLSLVMWVYLRARARSTAPVPA